MGFPVSPQDYAALQKAVASGEVSTGVDLIDSRTPVSPWVNKPNQRREDFIISEALQLMAVPAEQIRGIRPMIPQTLFPQTVGYDQTPLTIYDVLDADRWKPTVRSWISGPSRQVRRADWQAETWGGTSRNVSQSVNPGG